MGLQFSHEEYAERRRLACAEMVRQDLEGLVLFRQESLYYLCGYDTSGYTMFQCGYLRADGEMALLVRPTDRIQARLTSVVEDIRVWEDREDADPALDLRQVIDELGGRAKRIGIEYHAYGLTAQRGKRVDAALEGFCLPVDASDLVRLLRLVKSPAELEYVRKAGELCDRAWGVANARSIPGAFLGNVYGEMLDVILRGDGDPSASRWPMGAGEDALFVRYHTGKNVIGARDQVQHEFAAAYRHYHVAGMGVVVTGRASRAQRGMFEACRDALDASQARLRAGNTAGEVYDTHARVLTRAGYGHAGLKACGYTMGATYPPTWMDWPMLWTGNPQVLAPGMVFFLHMILLDDATGLAMSLGETAIVTEGACEPVSHAPRELVVN